MRRTVPTILTGTMLVVAMIGMPTSANSQTVIIIGNGAAPYPYAYAPPAYAAPTYYAEPGYYGYGYAASGYYPAYGYGYYRPYGWGYRRWGW